MLSIISISISILSRFSSSFAILFSHTNDLTIAFFQILWIVLAEKSSLLVEEVFTTIG
ncbi:MAG: hypothetical protein Q8S84_01560 [bacterium]|nr:hypothetical protein [bacterium]MDP3380254.1 hypothetical protein [bacterium]